MLSVWSSSYAPKETTTTTSKTATATSLPSSSAQKEASERNFMSDGDEEENDSIVNDSDLFGNSFKKDSFERMFERVQIFKNAHYICISNYQGKLILFENG
jgi:hypothetical protein